jgi:aminoglycoside phosphotransferase (APT) family kinase protein
MATEPGPVRSEERFDEAVAAEYLREVLPELGAGPIEFLQFHGGHANLTYLVRGGGREFVLRRPPLGEVAPGSHDMERESRVLSVLHHQFPLAPRAFHYCDDSGVIGKPFFVMERRTGDVIRGRWPESLPDTDDARLRVGTGLVEALASLHTVDFVALGLGDLGRPDGFVQRQVDGWTQRWRRARHDDVPDMETLALRLGEAVPEPQAVALLHNDFKLDNTMVGPSGDLVAVFDWDMATTGDPLVDLGSMLSYFEGPPEAAMIVPPDSVVLGGVLSADDVIAGYAERTGFDVSGIAWYRALGSFRIAVIIQQIYIRYVRGQTTDERFAVLGSVVPPIAAAGLRALG